MSPHPAPPEHEHLFHPGVADAGKAAREADPPRSYLAGCAVCGQSVQLGSDDTLPRVPWKGPVSPWPALQPGFRRP